MAIPEIIRQGEILQRSAEKRFILRHQPSPTGDSKKLKLQDVSCLMGGVFFCVTLPGLSEIITLLIQIPIGVLIYMVGSKVFHIDSFEHIIPIEEIPTVLCSLKNNGREGIRDFTGNSPGASDILLLYFHKIFKLTADQFCISTAVGFVKGNKIIPAQNNACGMVQVVFPHVVIVIVTSLPSAVLDIKQLAVTAHDNKIRR